MKKAIIGNGGFGREVFWSLTEYERNLTKFFIDDEFLLNESENTLPLSKLNTQEYEVIVAIGNPTIRENIIKKLPSDTVFFTHIHPSVIILDKKIKIGDGSIICAGTILTTNIILGKHTHLNLNTTIGHDTIVGDFFTTAPNANISGNCNIGKRVYFGTNSSVREKIKICDDVIIGLNGGVVKNINESGTYIGTPVNKIK